MSKAQEEVGGKGDREHGARFFSCAARISSSTVILGEFSELPPIGGCDISFRPLSRGREIY